MRGKDFMLEFIAMTMFWAFIWIILFIAFLIWLVYRDGNGPRGTGSA